MLDLDLRLHAVEAAFERWNVVRFYAEGKLARIESDRTGDGAVDTWEYYENGELDRVGTDGDGDGIVDSWERKRKAEPATETPAQPAAEGTPAEPPGEAPPQGGRTPAARDAALGC